MRIHCIKKSWSVRIRAFILSSQSKQKVKQNSIISNLMYFRCPRKEKRYILQLLPRALYWYNVRRDNKEANALLFLQLDSTMCSDCQYGRSRLYFATGFRRKAIPRSHYSLISHGVSQYGCRNDARNFRCCTSFR